MGLAEFQARCSTGAAEKKGGFRNNPTTKSLYLFQDRAAVDPSKARAELAVHDILLDYLDADEAEFRIQCERHELACMGEMGGKWFTLWGCVSLGLLITYALKTPKPATSSLTALSSWTVENFAT